MRGMVERKLPSFMVASQQGSYEHSPGLAEYLSPLSEQQLDCLANEAPCLSRSYLFEQFHRYELADACADTGRKKLICADKHTKTLLPAQQPSGCCL
jgi:hypothetical protein